MKLEAIKKNLLFEEEEARTEEKVFVVKNLLDPLQNQKQDKTVY